MNQAEARREAETMAALHGIEIEIGNGGPRAVRMTLLPDEEDPFDGDHSATTWAEALAMVQVYCEIAQERSLHAPG